MGITSPEIADGLLEANKTKAEDRTNGNETVTHTHEYFELLANIEWIRKHIMKPTKFWIKARYNPQLGTYFVPMGQMSIRKAKAHERPLYGDDTMLSFDTEQEYLDKIEALKKQGERVHP